jgi:hypothetical protein
MTIHAIAPSPPSTSGGDPLLNLADRIPLPLEGWHLRHTMQANGRSVVEVSDATGDLVGLITSTSLPILSVDAAWRGVGYDAAGERQWWALAMGHAPADDDAEPVVTFTRRAGRRLPARRAVVRPLRIQGLWVASTPGLWAAVSCRQGTDHQVRRLRHGSLHGIAEQGAPEWNESATR